MKLISIPLYIIAKIFRFTSLAIIRILNSAFGREFGRDRFTGRSFPSLGRDRFALIAINLRVDSASVVSACLINFVRAVSR